MKLDVTDEKDTGRKIDGLDDGDSLDWSSSNDEVLLKAEQEVLLDRTPYETPKKVPRTEILASPGKRNFGQMTGHPSLSDDTWPLSDDVFVTPSTTHRSSATGMLSPTNTPARGPSQASLPEAEPSTIASAVLAVLSDSQLSSRVEHQLVDLLNKYDLRTQGIVKGRDITRLAVQVKDKKIAELQARISVLEAEKETSRTVITHLKHDMATSPGKGRGRGGFPPRRSEV